MRIEQKRSERIEKYTLDLLDPFLQVAKIRKDVCIAGSEGHFTSNASRHSSRGRTLNKLFRKSKLKSFL